MKGWCHMNNITLDLKGALLNSQDYEKMSEAAIAAHVKLKSGSGISSDMTGWVDYPKRMDKAEYERLKKAASYIRNNSDSVVLLGIGGSYLGARAAIEAVRGNFHNELSRPRIYYAGQNLSGAYVKQLTEVIKNDEVCLVVVSKSGTTLETAASFRILKSILKDKYKDRACQRIFTVTDSEKGALRRMSSICGYEAFTIPNDIGGRYSVMTPVGLLPMASVGVDTDSFIRGLSDGMEEYATKDFDKNICMQYAAARNTLYDSGKSVEALVSYEPSFLSIAEWWKQLFGESEGKEGKGLFPASLNFTTDLHSMGQYVQEGSRILFETTVAVEESSSDMEIPFDDDDYDGLNYLSGEKYGYINRKAFEGTFMAHESGKVPGIVINVPKMDEYWLGKLLYFFMMSCGISGYMLGVDPFTQPGVEAYKKNMFKLLGKK